MKKTLLITAFLLSLLNVNAQITINRSDIAVAGDWFFTANDTLISASNATLLKAGGANKTWDITGWANKHFKDTTYYSDASKFPDAPAGCNLVSYTIDQVSGDTLPSFMNISNTELKAMIEMGELGIPGNQLKVFQFPSTMGTNFKDSFTGVMTLRIEDFGIPTNPLFDSIRINYGIHINSIIDGWGKLKMAAGLFDVLRQKSIHAVNITFKLRSKITGTYMDASSLGLSNMQETAATYTWLGKNTGHFLLEANEDTMGVLVDMTYTLASSKGLSGVREQKAMTSSTKAYPNPASEMITIETQVKQNTMVSLKVYDILGNEVMPETTVNFKPGMNQLPVDIGQLKPGIYFYTLNGNGINTSSKFVIK
ncbi:MAG: T9SS type A sorting domain-containing protein [Bacteroidota bacterium]|nr:T9SS type A sorting domain-containing protein [Bacteroidota bacterium]